MKILKEYTINLYHKSGDDFRHYLSENNDDVPAALREWALQMKSGYDTCMRLAAAFEGRDISAFADNNHISFEPGSDVAVGLLDMLAEEELVDVYEFNDDFDDEPGGE